MVEFCEIIHIERYFESLVLPVGEGEEGKKRSKTTEVAFYTLLVISDWDERTSICVVVLLIVLLIVLKVALIVALLCYITSFAGYEGDRTYRI